MPSIGQKATFKIVEEQQLPDYYTTVFLIREGEVVIQGLVNREGLGPWSFLKRAFRFLLSLFGKAPETQSSEENKPVDTYDLIYHFGVHQGKTAPCPDAVFVAGEGFGANDSEFIVITGYTQDGRANYAHLSVERGPGRVIRLVGSQVHRLSDDGEIKWRRNAAEELMRGFRDGAKG